MGSALSAFGHPIDYKGDKACTAKQARQEIAELKQKQLTDKQNKIIGELEEYLLEK